MPKGATAFIVIPVGLARKNLITRRGRHCVIVFVSDQRQAVLLARMELCGQSRIPPTAARESVCAFRIEPGSVGQIGPAGRWFFDPNRPEHYDDATIQKVCSQPFLDVRKVSLEEATPDLCLKGQSEYFRVLNEALVEAIQGDDATARVLKRVAQLWDMITSRWGRREQIPRWQQLCGRYPAAVRPYLKDPMDARSFALLTVSSMLRAIVGLSRSFRNII
ncbi:MAG: hypothetical protein ABJH45_15585 [Paracoccaceae bacterium]